MPIIIVARRLFTARGWFGRRMSAPSMLWLGLGEVAASTNVFGTGSLVCQSANTAGVGLTASSGTGALVAQASDIIGVGITQSSGTGILIAQASDITGVGITQWVATGALVAQASDITGVGITQSAGTGALVAQASDVTGVGATQSAGTGALSAQASDVTGVGISASNGTGVLLSQPATIAGVGTVDSAGGITGSGALLAQSSQISGAGTVTGVGVLSGGGWKKHEYKHWPLPPPAFPLEVETPAIKIDEPVPSWADVISRKPLTRPNGLVYTPTKLKEHEIPKKIPRPALMLASVYTKDDITSDEIIRMWKRHEEEELVTILMQIS